MADRAYPLKKFVSDLPPHPSEFDEYARRLCVVEKWIADRKKSAGKLYRRLDQLEAENTALKSHIKEIDREVGI